jgi:hypothetical protein
MSFQIRPGIRYARDVTKITLANKFDPKQFASKQSHELFDHQLTSIQEMLHAVHYHESRKANGDI